jgi:hypothetical protein
VFLEENTRPFNITFGVEDLILLYHL